MIASKARIKFNRRLTKQLGYRIPEGAFHRAVLDALATQVVFELLDHTTREQIIAFHKAFLDCSCSQHPFCGCPEQKFAKEIIELRESGLSHHDISIYLLDIYGIEIFPADILSFLEDTVHLLEAIEEIAGLEKQEVLVSRTQDHISCIEGKKRYYS